MLNAIVSNPGLSVLHTRTPAGRIVHRGSGAVVSPSEHGLDETTRGLKKLQLSDQELKDMEVARKIQEEEIKVRRVTSGLFVAQSHQHG